ncbi:PhoPQ-activated pathogenicity-related family protein [Winslowiella iniecta]|uniref:PhoPQ-activated pathogenicity-related family protein n=1 Tax=Winslowiella iniecta TaxID=1560201 RepID=UPI00069F99AB|nr:PhoPQ-activated protein PqaA family protein [Winslowiella iniecta]
MLRAKYLSFVALLIISGNSWAGSSETSCLSPDSDYSHLLSCYRQKLLSLPLTYNFINKQNLPEVELRHYELISQNWPEKKSIWLQWQHKVDIYIPEKPLAKRALIFINNGINRNIEGRLAELPSDMSQQSLASVARLTRTIVVSVSNIPNQYLTLAGESILRKEDDAVAYSWSLFLQDPAKNAEIPLHIPMAAAVSQAMSLAERELTDWKVDRFVVSGVSKRGWTSWLTLVSDPRVDAIVPFVFDLPGIRLALTHMYRSYGNNWPVAFYPYYMQNIDTQIESNGFTRLLSMIDPLQYKDTPYHSRLSVPKYMINASGDDFYVPDNTRYYYDQLAGVKSLRVVANSGHYDIIKYAESSLVPFINRLQQDKILPVIKTVHQQQNLSFSFSEPPKMIKRWSAINKQARDFRYACGIRYTATTIPVSNNIDITLDTPQQGWQASYIEATFSDGYVATSQVYITPDGKYPVTAPPVVGEACKTLPGRGLGAG